jgi:Asp-tRNA(Asn)/Glu-tRNA(Gln) amidotransferase A subunit family amidase
MDLCATPAVELARLIRARELSAAELLAAVLARIADANPAVNAIVTLAAEQATAAAAALDAQAARGSFAGPLHGLPIAVKDLAETAGIRTTFGSPLFASFVPDFDAPHVARLKQAGAVVIGKTNTPEFGAGSQTFNRVFGPTRNPYDTRLTPGGSSGGAAAAVAAGLIPFADGSDLGASVRNPASFCGLVGLRTTPGLVPADLFDPLGVVGPIARTAPDAALLLAGMCGTDPGLPMARPERPEEFLGLRPASLRGLRVAWTFDWVTCRCSRRSWPCSRRAAGRWRTPGARWPTPRPRWPTRTRSSRCFGPPGWPGWRRSCATTATRSRPPWPGTSRRASPWAASRSRRPGPGMPRSSGGSARSWPTGGYEVLALPTAQVVPFPVEQDG